MVLPGKQFPLIADIEKVVYGAGKGDMQNPARVGTIYYNRGVIAAVNYVEALRNAQKIHNKVGKPVTGADSATATKRSITRARRSARSSASKACFRRTS